MFTNKKDPLVDAVKSVMYEGNLKRQVEEAVNNHFGVSSRKAIPHEHLAEYDDLLSESYKQAIEEGNIKHPNQQKLDVHEPKKDKLTSKDFAMLRAGAKNKKIEEKITKDMSAGDVISDFVHSKNPKFKDKSKKERQKMALGAYYSKHPEKSKKMDESIESIMEEIRVNLEEQLVAVYESGDEQMFEEFVSSLTEEQLELLGLNEIAGAVGSALGSLAARAAATPIGQRAIGAAVGIGQKAVSAARSAIGTVSGSTAKAAQQTATTAQQTATTAQQSARTATTNMSRMAAGTNAQQAAQRASSAQQAATTATRQTNIARGTLGTAALGAATSATPANPPDNNDPGGSYPANPPDNNDPGGSYNAPSPAAKPAAKPAATPRTSTSAAIPVSKPKQQDDRPIAGFAPNVPSGQPGGSKWGNTFQESTHLKESLESFIRNKFIKG